MVLHQNKSFFIVKEIITEQSVECEIIFTSCASGRILVLRIYKNLKKLNISSINNLVMLRPITRVLSCEKIGINTGEKWAVVLAMRKYKSKLH